MESVTVSKAKLVEIVTENKRAHRAIFEEAVEGYRVESVRLLEDHIGRIKSGKVEKVYVSLPQPQDHSADYDRVLKMLDLSVDENVVIDGDSFAKFVMDDWSWKRDFIETSSMYSAAARRA